MVEHATWKGAPRRSLGAGWTPRWGHLPRAIRAVWQIYLHEVPARRTWPRAVLDASIVVKLGFEASWIVLM